ncbi:MAG: hypothetical protein AB8G16_05840 [Gammaproteobacteria bacterium]
METPVSLPPLSHHDVLRAAAPLTRAGLRVDLPASDRARRKIAFVQQALPDDPLIAVRHELHLLEEGATILIRIAEYDHRLQATLTTQGGDIDALAAALLRLAAEDQFRFEGEALVADSYDVAPEKDARLELTGCATIVRGLLIETDARTVIGEPMTTTLALKGGATPWHLPDDFLALTHHGWRPLTETDEGWSTTLQVPVRQPARGRETRRRFGLMAAQIAAALSAPPQNYHRERRAARWRLYLRRFIPVFVCVAIVAALPLLDRLVLSDERGLHPAFLSLPPLLMIGALMLTWREMPRIEIPPRPRSLAANAWPYTAPANKGPSA